MKQGIYRITPQNEKEFVQFSEEIGHEIEYLRSNNDSANNIWIAIIDDNYYVPCIEEINKDGISLFTTEFQKDTIQSICLKTTLKDSCFRLAYELNEGYENVFTIDRMEIFPNYITPAFSPVIYFLNSNTIGDINAALGYDCTNEIELDLTQNNIIPFICIYGPKSYYYCYGSYNEKSELRYFAPIEREEIETDNLHAIFIEIDNLMADGENLSVISKATFEIPKPL